MKKIILALVIFVSVNAAFAQTGSNADTIPVKINESFSAKYANADAIQWEIGDSLYTVTFTYEKKRHLIEYLPNGSVQLHRYDLNESQYPVAIVNSVSKNYPNYKIEDIERVEKDGKIIYKAELEGKPDYEVEFDEAGNVLSSKKE